MLQSNNYPPSPDLALHLRNHFIFRAVLPEDMVVVDPLLSETAMLRILIRGDWAAEFVPGKWESEGPTLLFGNNSRCFNVRVKGPFMVVGSAIRPGGWPAVASRKAQEFADRMVPAQSLWGVAAGQLYHDIAALGDDDAAIVEVLETFWRGCIAELGGRAADPAMAIFEHLADTDCTIRVSDAADRLSMSERVLERRCCATFGLTPKAVLRRSRFLDMAAVLRGIYTPGEGERAALRFSDQSHLNREFRFFMNMTPGAFERTPTPLLNAVLKLRQDRHR